MSFKNNRLAMGIEAYKSKGKREQAIARREWFINNSLYIFMLIAIVYIAIKNPSFLSPSSIANILTLSAASLPIALGIAGAIVLTGTDLSAGRIVGLTACISASILQPLTYANKMWPGMAPLPLGVVLLIVMIVGAIVGLVNGVMVARFNLHPFIATLGTQLIVYGALLIYLQQGNNKGQSISGMTDTYKNFVKNNLTGSSAFTLPMLVLYAVIITAIMWVIWNKTTFGKNMFAVGSNPDAARVSGVNVELTIIMVFILAGICYGYTGFIEGARIGSNNANTGMNYELDAISACVIGGVSFVGGIGKISGIIIGVILLRLIFVGLTALSIDQNLQYIIKGLIILVAVAIDMRKYMTKK